MKLRTSFFNFGVFKKNLTRFFPVWVLYSVGMTLILMATGIYQPAASTSPWGLRDVMAWLGPMTLANGAYAVCCAVTIFYDLFVTSRCNALHAMPLTRDCWFASNYLSGLTFGAISNLTMVLVLGLRYPKAVPVLLVFLLGSMLQFFVFYALTVFCIMLTGNAVGTVLLTGFFSLFSLLVFALVSELFYPLLWGVVPNSTWYARFSPVAALLTSTYCDVYYTASPFQSEGWRYLFVYSAAAVLLTVAAWWLYRKRALECAGDFLAFHRLAPVLTALVTPLCGCLVYAFFDIFGAGSYVYFAIGMVLTYFICQMLIRRSVRVFRVKTICGCGAILAVVAVSMFITSLDPLGIARYVPSAEDVKSVSIRTAAYYNQVDNLSSPEFIAAVIESQQAALEEHRNDKEAHSETVRYEVRYTLKNGKVVERIYYLPRGGTAVQKAVLAGSMQEAVFGTMQKYYDLLEDPNYHCYINGENCEREDALRLLDALQEDCTAGKLTIFPEIYDWEGHWMDLEFVTSGECKCVLDLFIPYGAIHTIEVLKELHALGDYAKA